MDHSIKLAKAFQLVDNGNPSSSKDSDMDRSTNNNTDQKTETKKNKSNNEPNNSNKKEAPICLDLVRKAKEGLRLYMRDRKATKNAEKKKILNENAEEKAQTGPSKSTRAEISHATQGCGDAPGKKNVGRLHCKVNSDISTSSLTITAIDGK